MQTRTGDQCGAEREAGEGTEEQDEEQAWRNKGASDLTLRYKSLSSPSEDVALTALNLDATLLGKRGPVMHLATREHNTEPRMASGR